MAPQLKIQEYIIDNNYSTPSCPTSISMQWSVAIQPVITNETRIVITAGCLMKIKLRQQNSLPSSIDMACSTQINQQRPN